jgi:hypothetical protein
VQVLPLKRERFAKPEPGARHREEERGPVAFFFGGRPEQVGKLLAGEGLDGFLALPGPLDQAELPPEALRGVRQEHAVGDGGVEHGSERGVDDAD